MCLDDGCLYVLEIPTSPRTLSLLTRFIYMTQFLPIFPLNIVVFPEEGLNLHIFEPRYVELINDCVRLQKPFGIPTMMNGSIQERGALMHVTEMSNGFNADEIGRAHV